MNDLLQAAKHLLDLWHVDVVTNKTPEEIGAILSQRVQALGDAVERAEKQEAVGFREWWDEHVGYGEPHRLANDRRVWTAAQQAERERVKEIVGKLSTPKGPWIHYETLLEKIDASEDS